MLIDQLSDKNGFTNTEKILADYILEHRNEVAELSAEEMGQASYTSKAAVLRLCKKLGLSGYPAFKKQLESEIDELYRNSEQLGPEPVTEKSTYRDIINIIPTLYENVISRTRLEFDTRTMLRVIRKLRHVEKIDLYAAGITATAASAAAFKFMTLGIDSAAYTGLNEHYVVADKHRKNKAAIVISFTGNNPAMVSIARYLHKNGIYVVGIAGSEQPEFMCWCSDFIEIYTRNAIAGLDVIESLTATNYILDILFTALLASDYQKNSRDAADVLTIRELVNGKED